MSRSERPVNHRIMSLVFVLAETFMPYTSKVCPSAADRLSRENVSIQYPARSAVSVLTRTRYRENSVYQRMDCLLDLMILLVSLREIRVPAAPRRTR